MESFYELKPMNLGGILDKTFKLVFQNFKYIFFVYIGYLPFLLGLRFLNNYLFIQKQSDILLPFSRMLNSLKTIGYTLFTSIIAYFFFSIITDILINSFLNKDIKIIESIKTILKKYWIIAITFTFIYTMVVFGFGFCIIPGIILFLFLSIWLPILLYENKLVFSTIGRSFGLSSKNFGIILGRWLIMFLILIGILLATVLAIIMIYSLSRIIDPSIPKINGFQTYLNDYISNFKFTPVTIIATVLILSIYSISIMLNNAITMSFCVVLYFDLKIRHENFGIETMTESFIESEKNNELSSPTTNNKLDNN